MSILVDERMTRDPIAVQERMLIQTAASLMQRHHFRHLPAISEEGRLVGLLDDASVFARGEFVGTEWSVYDRRDHGLLVLDVMRPPPLVVRPGATLASLLRPMVERGEDAAVIVDQDRRPIGIFTAHDAIRAAPSVVQISLCAHEIANSSVLTLGTQDTVGAALDTMRAHRIRHIVVVEGGKPVGVISWRTLVELDADQRRHMRIRDLHLPAPELVTRNASLYDVAEHMVVQKVGCLPVVDAQGGLCGIVSQSDLMKAMLDALAS